MKELNWNRLNDIGPTLTPFEPTKEKMKFISNWLLKGFLNMSDENRTPEKIALHLAYYFPYTIPEKLRPFHIFYEIGNFAGLLGFADIHIGYKATVLFKYWSKKQWGHRIMRDLHEVHRVIMDELDLVRISAQTPDLQVMRLAEKLNYRLEGRQAFGFRWGGRNHTNYLLRRLSDIEQEIRDKKRGKNTHIASTESSEERLNV